MERSEADIPTGVIMRLSPFQATIGLLLVATIPPAKADPNALWNIVHGSCVPHEERFREPMPCLNADVAAGFAVLKDLVGATQTLLIPTARVTGIEDPAVLSPDAPNYFALAWRQVGITRALADDALPRDAISLAINSFYGRTQNQLHIHIDCIRTDVRALLQEHLAAITTDWSDFPMQLAGHPYWARRVWTLDRPGANPFELVAREIQGSSQDMGRMTIVAVGATFDGQQGFILLAGRAAPEQGNRGSGEELQDHGCALAHH